VPHCGAWPGSVGKDVADKAAKIHPGYPLANRSLRANERSGPVLSMCSVERRSERRKRQIFAAAGINPEYGGPKEYDFPRAVLDTARFCATRRVVRAERFGPLERPGPAAVGFASRGIVMGDPGIRNMRARDTRVDALWRPERAAACCQHRQWLSSRQASADRSWPAAAEAGTLSPRASHRFAR